MDAITTATTFSTIISLLADFVAHRGASESKEFADFMAWLDEQRHSEIRSMLQSNTSTVVGIKALLTESRQEILESLSALDRSLASVASGIGMYRNIAQATHPESLLSEQAISILDQFYDSGASQMLEGKLMAGTMLVFLEGKHGTVTYSEPRFLEDDLNTLLKLGLLDLGHNGKGDRIFKFKRATAVLIEHRRGA